jgi:hypothetical protein
MVKKEEYTEGFLNLIFILRSQRICPCTVLRRGFDDGTIRLSEGDATIRGSKR